MDMTQRNLRDIPRGRPVKKHIDTHVMWTKKEKSEDPRKYNCMEPTWLRGSLLVDKGIQSGWG